MAKLALPAGSLAEKLKALRTRTGKSLQQVGDAVGVSKAYVWDLESGEKGINPTIDVLRRLADYYRVSVAYLSNETPDDATSDKAMHLWRNLNSLDDQDQHLVADMIESLKRRRDAP